jgi:bifunctional non-homologous end joining protein LigD
VFDFDPDEDLPFAKVKAAARELRQHLKDLKLESFLKVTGGKVLHVVVPIARKPNWAAVKGFARDLANAVASDSPDLYTTNSRKAERKGKIYIDYLRNDKTASAVAPYSIRARDGAPVAAPITWDELGKLKSADAFGLDAMERRIAKLKKNPWADIQKLRQSLPLKS